MQTNDPMQEITRQDTTWDVFVQDQLADEARDNRNLLIAVRVLRHLREIGKNKSWLAERMGLSPQRVSVILKGRGNMTLDSVRELEKATGLTLLEVPAAIAGATRNRKTGGHGLVKANSGFFYANMLSSTPLNCELAGC